MKMENVEAKVLEEIHPFTLREKEEIKSDILQNVKPYLVELETWRRKSLSSNFRFDYTPKLL